MADPIKVWRFEDAPELYKEMSTGMDSRVTGVWIAEIPADYDGVDMPWLNAGKFARNVATVWFESHGKRICMGDEQEI